MEKKKLTRLVRDWLNAWNSRDIDRLMDHYHEDIEFTSPTVIKRWNNPSGKLIGKEALRKHFMKGFEQANHIQFELLGILEGIDGFILVYRKEMQGMGADLVTLNEMGKAMKVVCYRLD
jgi:ketosteroid isomerase-like protein